jgi:hypothetical protein
MYLGYILNTVYVIGEVLLSTLYVPLVGERTVRHSWVNEPPLSLSLDLPLDSQA